MVLNLPRDYCAATASFTWSNVSTSLLMSMAGCGCGSGKHAIVCIINYVRVLDRTRGSFSAVAERSGRLHCQLAFPGLRGTTISVRIPCEPWTSGGLYIVRYLPPRTCISRQLCSGCVYCDFYLTLKPIPVYRFYLRMYIRF
jgi:hypothetical protein